MLGCLDIILLAQKREFLLRFMFEVYKIPNRSNIQAFTSQPKKQEE
jgi:hypothetical protein